MYLPSLKNSLAAGSRQTPRKVKEHPPDRSPEEFERVRDAYDSLRDPRRRMRDRLLAVDPFAPLVSVIELKEVRRRFAGPQPWLEVLKGK